MSSAADTIKIMIPESLARMGLQFRLLEVFESDHPLFEVISKNNIAAIKQHIAENRSKGTLSASMSFQDKKGRTAFMLACLGQVTSEMRLHLLSAMDPKSLCVQDEDGKTALIYAIENLPEAEAMYVLKFPTDLVVQADKNGNNLLMKAVEYDRKNIVSWLLSLKEINDHLTDRNTSDEDALDIAINIDSFEIADILLQHGFDFEYRDSKGNTRLLWAIENLQDRPIQYLRSRGASLESRNSNTSDTALIRAVRKTNVYLTRYLLEQGADSKVLDGTGKTLEEIIKSQKQNDDTRDILSLLANPPLFVLPIDYKTWFLNAVQKGDEDTLDYLLKVVDSKFIHLTCGAGKSPFHIAAELGQLSSLKYLLEYMYQKKADNELEEDAVHPLNLLDDGGNTPMLCAAAAGQLEIVKYLEKENDSFQNQNKTGETALILAKKFNRQNVVKYIEDREAEKKRCTDLETLNIPEDGMKIDSFVVEVTRNKVDYKVLRPKGVALMQYYMSKKLDKTATGYMAENEAALKHALSLMKRMVANGSFGLIYRWHGHSMAIKCERYSNQNHIIMMDSLGIGAESFNLVFEHGTSSYLEALKNIVAKVFKGDRGNTFFYCNEEARQVDAQGPICMMIAIKDLRKMMKIPYFFAMLHQQNYIIEKKNEGITFCKYFTPWEFMRLEASPNLLKSYVNKHPIEAQKVRKNRQGHSESLLQYAFRPKFGYGASTPKKMLNRKFGPKHPKEPQFILQSRWSDYFTAKYVSIVSEMSRVATQEQLQFWIERHNAAKLKITTSGQIMSVFEERESIMQAHESQFSQQQVAQEESRRPATDQVALVKLYNEFGVRPSKDSKEKVATELQLMNKKELLLRTELEKSEKVFRRLDAMNAVTPFERKITKEVLEGTYSEDVQSQIGRQTLQKLRSYSKSELREYTSHPENLWTYTHLDYSHQLFLASGILSASGREIAEDLMRNKGFGSGSLLGTRIVSEEELLAEKEGLEKRRREASERASVSLDMRQSGAPLPTRMDKRQDSSKRTLQSDSSQQKRDHSMPGEATDADRDANRDEDKDADKDERASKKQRFS